MPHAVYFFIANGTNLENKQKLNFEFGRKSLVFFRLFIKRMCARVREIRFGISIYKVVYSSRQAIVQRPRVKHCFFPTKNGNFKLRWFTTTQPIPTHSTLPLVQISHALCSSFASKFKFSAVFALLWFASSFHRIYFRANEIELSFQSLLLLVFVLGARPSAPAYVNGLVDEFQFKCKNLREFICQHEPKSNQIKMVCTHYNVPASNVSKKYPISAENSVCAR